MHPRSIPSDFQTLEFDLDKLFDLTNEGVIAPIGIISYDLSHTAKDPLNKDTSAILFGWWMWFSAVACFNKAHKQIKNGEYAKATANTVAGVSLIAAYIPDPIRQITFPFLQSATALAGPAFLINALATLFETTMEFRESRAQYQALLRDDPAGEKEATKQAYDKYKDASIAEGMAIINLLNLALYIAFPHVALAISTVMVVYALVMQCYKIGANPSSLFKPRDQEEQGEAKTGILRPKTS